MEYRPVPLGFERLPEAVQLARSRAFLASLQERRSVRRFSDEPVPRELVENAIRAAGTAPSGPHQQPWTFVVVSYAELKARLRELLGQPENERPFILIPVGYPADGAEVPDLERKPLEQISVWR